MAKSVGNKSSEAIGDKYCARKRSPVTFRLCVFSVIHGLSVLPLIVSPLIPDWENTRRIKIKPKDTQRVSVFLDSSKM